MCVVSMVMDHYRDKWIGDGYKYPTVPTWPIMQPTGPTAKEFDDLKREVMEMKELLKKALAYDKRTGQEDCEMQDKVNFVKKVAESVGVDLTEIFEKK